MAEMPKVSVEHTVHEALVLMLNALAKVHSVKVTTIKVDWVDLTTKADLPAHEYRVHRLDVQTESSHL